MPHTVNGCGTTFYGSAEPHSDGSYVVTTWIVFVYIPLIPLGSKRVLPVSQDHLPWYKRSGQLYRTTSVPLHMPHLWKGWGVTLGLFVLLSLMGGHH